MATLPRFQRSLGRQISPSNPAAGAPESAISSVLENFSARRNARLEKEAAEEGFVAGQAAEPGAEAAGEDSSFGRAFNEGVLVSRQAALQTDLKSSITQFETDSPDDPEAFSASVAGLVDGLIESTDPKLQPFVRQRAADYAGAASSRIIGRQQTSLRKEATNDLARGAEGMLDDATTAAFEGNILMIEARRQELTQLFEMGVAGGFIEAGEAAEQLEGFERRVMEQEVVGDFDRLVRDQGIEKGLESIRRWQATKPSSVGLTAEDHAGVTRQLVGLLNRESALTSDARRKDAAQANAETSARTAQVVDATKVLSDGFPIDKKTSEAVAESIQILMANPEPAAQQQAKDLAANFDRANEIQEKVHQFKRATPTDRDAAIIGFESELNTAGATVDQVEKLKLFKRVNADVTNQLEKDPRGFLQRENIIEEDPLDFTTAGSLIDSLASRDTDVATQLARQAVGKLTAAEATEVSKRYFASEIEERLDILSAVTAGTFDDAGATLAQINESGAPEMAFLGGLVRDGNRQLANAVMVGDRIIAANPTVKPKDTDFRGVVNDIWGGAMIDAQDVLEDDFLPAAIAKYVELKSRAGDLSDIFNESLFEKALNEVMPTVKFNGRRLALPPGVTSDQFDDWTDTWDANTFIKPNEDPFVLESILAGVPLAETPDFIRDNGLLVELGSGVYGIQVESAATGLFKTIEGSDGKPFELTFPRADR